LKLRLSYFNQTSAFCSYITGQFKQITLEATSPNTFNRILVKIVILPLIDLAMNKV